VILYISPEELKLDLISPSWTEMRALIFSRNQLAGFIRNANTGTGTTTSASPLPPLLQDAHECQYCYQAAECVAHHAVLEGGTARSSGMPELYSYVLKGVTPAQLRYYKHWDDLINLEQIATQSAGSVLCAESEEKSLSGLTLLSCEKQGEAYMLTLQRAANESDPVATSRNRTVQGLSVDDRVQLSVGARSVATATLNNTTGKYPAGTDIEDIGLSRFRSHSQAVMATEMNLCTGTVSAVTDAEVQVLLTEDPRRLRRYVLFCIQYSGAFNKVGLVALLQILHEHGQQEGAVRKVSLRLQAGQGRDIHQHHYHEVPKPTSFLSYLLCADRFANSL
jgi:hypothetical protein